MKFLKTYWNNEIIVTSNKNGHLPEKGQEIVLPNEIIAAKYWEDVTARICFKFSTESFYTIDNVAINFLDTLYNSIQARTVFFVDHNGSNICINARRIKYFVVTLNYNCLKLHVITGKTGKIKTHIEYLGENNDSNICLNERHIHYRD